MSFAPTVAVTALNATDNPGPGVGVIRGLRADPEFRGRIVGLAYDGLEPGIYAEDLVDDVYLIPYPSQGTEAVRARLEVIHETTPIDVLIPNLDAELPVFADLDPWLRSQGIATFMPTRAQIDLRSKANLAALGERSDIDTPATKVVSSPEDLYTIADDVPFPLWVKGVYYGARRAANVSEAVAGFHEMAAKWGLPVIVQADVVGDEIDVVAVGDGEGGMIGAVPMRKTFLTDKGKGWAGVTIRDERLTALAERFFAATRWRGPCEIEMVLAQPRALPLGRRDAHRAGLVRPAEGRAQAGGHGVPRGPGHRPRPRERDRRPGRRGKLRLFPAVPAPARDAKQSAQTACGAIERPRAFSFAALAGGAGTAQVVKQVR